MMQPLYITGMGCISSQDTFNGNGLAAPLRWYNNNRLPCVEPDYSQYLDAGTLRRMTAIARYGMAAAVMAMRDAGIKTPGAIITGTGYGLLENSEKFLKPMVESNETALSPTAFMQSTHNSVSSAIALLTNCNAYNNTYSHKGFSFESALLDAAMLMEEQRPDNVLVGTYEGMAETTFMLLEKLGIYRANPCNSQDIVKSAASGVIAGEGSSFFVLSASPGNHNYGLYMGTAMFYNPGDIEETKQHIHAFLQMHGLAINDIDLVLSGICGDKKLDELPVALNNSLFSGSSIAAFKHLCGEFMTASAFGFWLAAQILNSGRVPDDVFITDRKRPINHILLYNVYGRNNSLMLFKKC